MIAYILFLFICVVYHIISCVFNLEFLVWERIIAAATIASYAFTLSSSPKMMSRTDKKQIAYVEQEIELLQKIQKAKISIPFICDDIDKKISDNRNEVLKCKKNILKQDRNAFLLEVAGFLIFLCILSFNGLFIFLKGMQEICTLIAFLLILVLEFVEDLINEINEDTFKIKAETYGQMVDVLNNQTDV